MHNAPTVLSNSDTCSPASVAWITSGKERERGRHTDRQSGCVCARGCVKIMYVNVRRPLWPGSRVVKKEKEADIQTDRVVACARADVWRLCTWMYVCIWHVGVDACLWETDWQTDHLSSATPANMYVIIKFLKNTQQREAGVDSPSLLFSRARSECYTPSWKTVTLVVLPVWSGSRVQKLGAWYMKTVFMIVGNKMTVDRYFCLDYNFPLVDRCLARFHAWSPRWINSLHLEATVPVSGT